MTFGVGRPPTYTQIESFPFKQWLYSIYTYILTSVSLVTVTSSYTLGATVFYVRANATSGVMTITLPLALNQQGRNILIKKVDASVNAVTVGISGSDTIEGSTTKTLASQWDKLHVISNGSNGWEIV